MAKKAAAAAAESVDELLATKPKTRKVTKPVAIEEEPVKTKAAPASKKANGTKAAPVKTTKRAKVEEPDEEDLLATKPKRKAAANGSAKKPVATPTGSASPNRKGSGEQDRLRTSLLKVRKATSYADLADKLDCNIRTLRVLTRAMVGEGHLELTKEGTIGFVRSLSV